MTPATPPEAPPVGLREQNRRETTAKLEAVALALFTERGFDNVTIDEIAEQAGVSRRTFFRYFPAKEDVLFPDVGERREYVRMALLETPNTGSPITAVRRAVMSLASFYEDDRERLLRRNAIMAGHAGLEGRYLAQQRQAEQALTALMAEWMGVEPAKDLRPSIVAATALAAVRVAMAAWLEGGGRQHLPSMVEEALDLLDGGLVHGISIVRTEPAPPDRR